MILSVLLADDEFFIRQRLMKIIEWEKLSLRCVGEAENGEQAIDFVTNTNVDILLLDIKMPGKSGIEVLEYIHRNSIKTKIIFLSGYNDFEYAQKAISFQAVNYLLKPIDKQSLEDALISCRDRILSEMKKQNDMEIYSRYLRRSLIYKVAAGTEGIDGLLSRYPEFADYKSSCYLSVYCPKGIVSCMDRLQEQKKPDNFEAEFFQENEVSAIVQFYFAESSVYAEISAFCQRFLDRFPGYIFMSLGQAFNIRSEWKENYRRAVNELENRYFHNEKALVGQQTGTAGIIEKKTFMSLRQNMILYLNSKNTAALKNLLDNLFNEIRNTRNPNQLNLVITEILIVFNVYSNNSFLPVKNVNTFATELIDDGYSLEALKSIILSFGQQCMDKLEIMPSDAVRVKKISEYIEANYTNPELSVSLISEHFSLSPVYMGSAFKKITGQSIVQYITYLRMEKAKQLLNSKEYKVVQVAEMVGYSDVFYFSKKFKKVHGYSPRDYVNIEAE